MIETFRLTNGVNDYAVIVEPEKHEEERKQLIQEGYIMLSQYVKDGKKEELWFK